MATKVSTLDNIKIAILEPRGSLIGNSETDEVKAKAQDLLEQGNRKLIIDLNAVTYLNSTGIGTLVAIHSMYTKQSGKVKLCSLGKSVENVFVITRLISMLDVEETRDSAIKNFQ